MIRTFLIFLMLTTAVLGQTPSYVYIGAHGSITSKTLSYDRLFGASFGGAFVRGETTVLADINLDVANKRSTGKGHGYRADFGVRRALGERGGFVEGRLVFSGLRNQLYGKDVLRAEPGAGMTLRNGVIVSGHAILPLKDENRGTGAGLKVEGFKWFGKHFGIRGEAKADFLHYRIPHPLRNGDPTSGSGMFGDVSGGLAWRF